MSEYYAHNIASGYAMIRTDSYKYVYHTPADATHGAERELYDLSEDPGEFHNLAREAKHRDRIRSMHAALVEELGEAPDATERRRRADYARGYGRKEPKRNKAGLSVKRPSTPRLTIADIAGASPTVQT